MSGNDCNFARHRITWKLDNITRDLQTCREPAKTTPTFTVLLDGKETQWKFTVGKTRSKDIDHLACYLYNDQEASNDFSIKLAVSIETPQKTYEYSKEVVRGMMAADSNFPLNVVSINDLFDDKKQLFDNGVLTLQFEFELIKVNDVESFPAVDTHFAYVEKLINNEAWSDFVFVCSDKEKIFVNKCNIAQCPSFASMFKSNMSEQKTGIANIEDIDSETMLELIRFICCGRVNKLKKVQLKLLIAANKYGILKLKIICVSSLMQSISMENVFEVLRIADLVDEKLLEENCIDFIKCKYWRIKVSGLWPDEFQLDYFQQISKSCSDNPTHLSFKNGNIN